MLKRLWARLSVRIMAYIIAIICVFNAAVWVFSPLLSHKVLSDVLEQNRVTLNKDSQVRVNLFIAKITVNNLMWTGTNTQRFELKALELDFRLLSLFSREFEITQLTVQGLNIPAHRDKSGLKIAGFELANSLSASHSEAQPSPAPQPKPEPQPQPKSETVANTAPFSLSDLPLALNIPLIIFKDIQVQLQDFDQTHNLALNMLRIERSFVDTQVIASELTLEANINGAAVAFDTQLMWNAEKGSMTMNLSLDDFSVAPYLYLAELDQPVALTANIDFTLALELPSSSDLAAAANTLKIVDSQFTLQHVNLRYAPYLLQFDALSLAANQAAYSNTQQEPTLNLPWSFSLEQFKLEMLEKNEPQLLASLASINTQGAIIEGAITRPNLTLEQFLLQGLVVGGHANTQPLLNLSALTVNDITANAQSANIADITIGKMVLQAIKNEQGEWANLLLPPTSGESEPLAEPAVNNSDTALAHAGTGDENAGNENTGNQKSDANQGADYAVNIGRIALSEPALTSFYDASTNPVFDLKLNIETMAITDIDTTKPEQYTALDASLSDGHYFNNTVAAKFQIFNPKPSGEFTIDSKQFPLYKVSPYLESQLGFDILAGELDIDAKGTIDKAELDSLFKIGLRGPTFSSGDDSQEEGGEVIGNAAIGLNVALNMLKDSKGNIRLKLPVDGNINDPNFGLGSIFTLVVKKAVMSQAKSQLIKTFVPYGQLLSVAVSAGNYAMKVRFADLEFIAGQNALDEPNALLLKQLERLLTDRPKVDLRLCPIATAADVLSEPGVKLSKALHNQANELSQARAQEVKRQLVAAGIAPNRLLLCGSRFDNDKNAKPRIEFTD